MRTLFAPVTVYSQPQCRFCYRVFDALTFAGIEFDYVDITKNDEARTYLKEVLQISTVPVVVTDTHDPIIGYQPEQLEELIAYLNESENEQ